jgi:hypothetical protein
MDLEEVGVNTENWVDSVQDRGYWWAIVNATGVSYFNHVVSVSDY